MSATPIMAGAELPALAQPLARLRQRCRLYLALEGLLTVCAAVVGAALVQLLLDRFLKLPLDQRVVLNIGITGLWCWVIYRALVRRLRLPLSDVRLAQIVDRAHPELADRIATGVQFAAGQVGDAANNSPVLVQAVIDEACAAAERVTFLTVLNHRRARRAMLNLGGIGVIIALAFVLLPDLMYPWFRRNWLMQDIPWPQSTHIEPDGFDAAGRRKHPRGEELEIAARIFGTPPRSATLVWTGADGRRGRTAMTRVGEDRLTAALGALTDDLTFRIVGGDERTREFHVVVVDRPRVAHVSAEITPPAYTELPSATVEQQVVLEMLRGSRLKLDVTTNKPVAKAEFHGAADGGRPSTLVSPTHVHVEWDSPESGTYHFELTDFDGFEDARPVEFNLKVVPDLPPTARLTAADVGEFITPQAVLQLTADFEDTYGLSTVAAHAQRQEQPPQNVPLTGFARPRTQFQATPTLDVTGTGVVPGERLRLWAQATDTDPNGPNVGRSNPIELRVLSRNDFLNELARRELELRREFERLISAQRGLKDGLERLAPRAGDAAAAAQWTALSRRQSWHASQCLTLSQSFQHLLGEMQTNRVARSADERRLGDRIITPLDALGRELMPAIATELAALTQGTVDDAAKQVARQDELLRRMQDVLSNMLEYEGFREAVKLLEQIIGEEEQVHGATVEELERQLREILGPTTTPTSQGAP